MSGATLAPQRDAASADSDQRLVAAVRRGDDRAFEILYERYQRRIHAYVLGMVKDHGRAEDVTQEVFVSALRRMRETEQPLAFKPWLYQIAKNGCIDAFRRSKRAEEVSYDADDALAPGDHSKLIGSGPSPDAAVAAKQDLESLCGAFGGLSETHHEILVLRELEGLSYQEIGRRMGMSRPAVESTLFRARRRLTEEYDDIVSGARCQRIEGIIVLAAQSQLGSRDTRRLARHLSHCQSCRREALAAGLDRELLARPSVRKRIASRVAGLLPFPALLKLRRGAEDATTLAPSGRGANWASQLPLLSDHLSSGWGKAAAGAAMLVASVGAGVGVHHQVASTPEPRKPVVTQERQVERTAAPRAAGAPDRPAQGGGTGAATPASDRGANGGGKSRGDRDRDRVGGGNRIKRSSSPVPSDRDTSGGGDQAEPKTTADSNPAPARADREAAPDSSSKKTDSDGGGDKRGGGDGGSKSPTTPSVPNNPAAPVQETVKGTTEALDNTVQGTTGALNETVQKTTGTVDETVEQVAGAGPVSETVDRTTDVVDDVVGGVKGALDGGVGGVGQTLNGVTGCLTQPHSTTNGG
jgi:RNA polymerase sigma factor (sigma-70 family)